MARRPSRSVLGVVVFTDIVGSTAIADELGDRRWREMLSRHHAMARRELRRFGGREIDTAGDGFFVLFDRPAEAIRWADAFSTAVRDVGIEIRAGVHVGESEAIGKKVSGMTVHIGARVLSVAGAGEILVTSTVREMIPGSGIGFVEHGVHQLKGVPGEWRLFRVSTIDGRVREVPAAPEEAKQRRDVILPPAIPRRARALVVAGVGIAIVAGVAFLVNQGSGHVPESSASGPARASQLVFVIDARSASPRGTLALPGHPTAVAWGAAALWVTLGPEGKVVKMDPATGRVQASYSINIGSTGIAVDDSAAWVVGSSGTVARIDVESGHVDTLAVGGKLEAVAIGADAIWVSTSQGTVTRIDPTTRRIEATIDLERERHNEGADAQLDIRRAGLVAAPGRIGSESQRSQTPCTTLLVVDATSVLSRNQGRLGP